MVTNSDWLSLAHIISAIHAPASRNGRTGDTRSPFAPTTARPREARMPFSPCVETNAIDAPSGENSGDVFIPSRSTIVRCFPSAMSTA